MSSAEKPLLSPTLKLEGLRECTAHFDAGTRGGNPGESCIGVYAEIDIPGDPFVYKLRYTELVGVVTNNQAEWLGMIKTLEIFERRSPQLERLAIVSDSKLVVMQALGTWRVRGHLISYWERAMNLAQTLTDRGVVVSIKHVRRELNREADALVTARLDEHMNKPRGY